ncbi:hypothetical protein FRC03_002650 [Tulasnella sp. 419]|nr:hypothetical protein FRC03_002650 [Tulasnella sp. 419]
MLLHNRCPVLLTTPSPPRLCPPPSRSSLFLSSLHPRVLSPAPGPAATNFIAQPSMQSSERLTCCKCKKTLPSAKGLSSHYSQSEPCMTTLLSQQFQDISADSLMHDSPSDSFQDESVKDPPSKRRRVTVEEVPDDDEDDGGPPVTDVHPTAAQCHTAVFRTVWEKQRKREVKAKQELYHPFDSMEEFELAKWLATSGLSQEAIDAFLCLDIIRARVQPSFASKYEFFKKVDQLPIGPAFSRMTVLIKGDILDDDDNVLTEEVEMFVQDPVEFSRQPTASLVFITKCGVPTGGGSYR